MYKYIEYGQQPQEYGGKAKAPADEFKIGFKLYGGPDGCYNDRTIDSFELAVSNNAKAGAKKAFDKLNWKGDLKHPAQAMGRAFMVTITVKKNETTGKETNRLDLNGIFPAVNPADGKEVALPPLDPADRQFFFFQNPTAETWAALYVEGKWDDGGSKNKVQEKILTALNFPGSKLEQMISGVVLPDLAPDAPVVTPAVVAPVAETPAAVVAPTAPAAPVMPSLPVMP
ncbi:hypothetical protein D9M71_574350 [compost metagenome]